MSINQVSISGNLTRDAELRANAMSPVLTFSVAVNESKKNNQTGEWESYPNYIDCVLFGERAVKISDYMRKGLKVAVSGRLHQNRWQDRETGSSRSKIELYANEIIFMSQSKPETQTPATPVPTTTGTDVYDSDIPF